MKSAATMEARSKPTAAEHHHVIPASASAVKTNNKAAEFKKGSVEMVHRVRERLATVEPLKKYYTNENLYDLFSPIRAEMPYVYDNFEWPHCDVSAVGGSVSLLSLCTASTRLFF